MIQPALGRSARAAAALTVFAFGVCTTRPMTNPTGEMAGLMPVLSVERFLQAANARDFEAMRLLFGTHDGPIRGERKEIELRMAAIAEILRHEDYRVMGDQREPGRDHPTSRGDPPARHGAGWTSSIRTLPVPRG